jgi:hypothetical protein
MNEIKDDFFVVIERDKDPKHRWVAVIGKRKAIDCVHHWCTTHLQYDDFKWFSIFHNDRDAVVLDCFFFDEPTYQIFYNYHQKHYVGDEE